MSQDKTVLKVIIERKSGKKDKRKIGLFLPGGGMRGVFGGGVMVALKELGLTECFDVIYGFSSGAFSGAYLLSGNPEVGTSIYYENLSEGRFIQPKSIAKSLNLDYFCDEVVRQKKKLNLNKLRKSETEFKIYVTNLGGQLEFFTNKDDVDLIEALKASCSFPGFYSPLIKIKGRKYCDGNALELVPIREAIKDGCTDVLVVSTVCPNYREKKTDLVHFISVLLTRHFPKKFKHVYRNRIANYNRDLDIIFGREAIEGINIFSICPNYSIKAGEDNKDLLKEYADQGYKKALKAFSFVEGGK